MIRVARLLMLALAVVLLTAAAFLAARGQVAGAIAMLALAVLAGMMERMMAT